MIRLFTSTILLICVGTISNGIQAAPPNAVTGNEHPVPESDLWLTYSGQEGPGKGKHVVLIAAEQEYRSEQAIPMLARILSTHHGFDTTVLFSVNAEGMVDPTLPTPDRKDETTFRKHNIPGRRRRPQRPPPRPGPRRLR